jgi:hypothetical protein
MRTRGVTTFTWSSLDPLPDGAIAFEEATGFYDVEEHRAYERWRMPRARAVPILGGLAYAFRTRCAACEPGRREALHVLGAAAFSEAVGGGASDAHFDDTFTHAHVPLDAGTSGGARMFVLERVAALWRKNLKMPFDGVRGSVLLAVHATRGASGEAVVTAFVEPSSV